MWKRAKPGHKAQLRASILAKFGETITKTNLGDAVVAFSQCCSLSAGSVSIAGVTNATAV
jgi:hypothetical protein